MMGCIMVGRLLIGAAIGWLLGFFAVLVYWYVVESAVVGQQYADPFLPSLAVGGFLAPIGALLGAVRKS